MKKSFLLFVFVIISTLSFGQSKVKLGLNGGLNYSSLRGNDLAENLKPGFSFLTGISFEYFLKENLSIGANLNYESKIAKDKGTIYLQYQDGSSEIVKSDAITNYNYLVLPIYVNYYFGENKDFYINGGLFLGYLLNSKLSSKKFNDETSTTNLNKKLDAGLVFGLGKKVRLNDKNDLKIELRENLGLVNTSDVRVYNNGTIKTNAINLILNWSFNL